MFIAFFGIDEKKREKKMSIELKCKLKIRLSADVNGSYFIEKMKSLGAEFTDIQADWYVDVDGDIKELQNAIVVVSYDRVWEVVDEVSTNMRGAILMELLTTGVVNDGISIIKETEEIVEKLEDAGLVEDAATEKSTEDKFKELKEKVKTKKEVVEKKDPVVEKVILQGKKHVDVSSGAKWTEKETATLMLLVDDGLPAKDIAETLGRNYNSVYKKIKRLERTDFKKKRTSDISKDVKSKDTTEVIKNDNAWTEEELDILSVNLDKDVKVLEKMLGRPARQIERKIDRMLDGKER